MSEIDNLSIRVTSNADEVARVFDRLASSAGRLRGAASGAAGRMQDMAQGAQDAGTATQEAGTASGSATPRIRNVGVAAKDAGDKAKKGASGLTVFWQSLKRIAFYRFIRTIIREITDAFKTGISNLYHWSDLVNGHFAASMDRLATSSQYLKNSLGAMVSPLIESLVPVLDVIIDKIVDVFNFFNMLVAAVSGADTYTVAKKAAAVWDDSANKTKKAAKSAADDIKRTILGFDEINKLVKPNSSSGGIGSSSGNKQPDYSSMFEEKPLTGVFKKISEITDGWPDWLKALLGVGTAALAIFGIPALLKSIWDLLKKLFVLKIPDWFRWLFGPKDDNNNDGINLPDKIELPDGKIKVDVDPVSMKQLNDIPIKLKPENDAKDLFNTLLRQWFSLQSRTLFLVAKFDNTARILFATFKNEWDDLESHTLYISPKLDNSANVLFSKFKAEWSNIANLSLYMSPKLDNTAKALYGKFKKDWNDTGSKLLYFSPKLDNTAKTLYNTFKTAWDNAGSKTLYFAPKMNTTAEVMYTLFLNSWKLLTRNLEVTPEFDTTPSELFAGLLAAWNLLTRTLYVSPKLDNTAKVLFDRFKSEWNNIESRTVYASPKLDNTARVLFESFKKEWKDISSILFVNVGLKKWNWTKLSKWVGSDKGLYVSVGLKHWGWENIENFIGTAVTIAVGLKKWAWDTLGKWTGADNGLDVAIGLLRRGWETLGKWTEADKGIYVSVGLVHWNWDNIADYIGTAVTVAIGLNRWGWNNIENFIGTSIFVSVGLTHWGWYTIQDWIGTAVTVSVALNRWGWDSLWSWVGDEIDVYVSLVRNGWKNIADWIGDRVSVKVDLIAGQITLTGKNATGGGGTTSGGGAGRRKKSGGIYQYGLGWSSIPQYAGGTLNAHGSLFLAGERGPEIVGHVGGRTEVLNKSQLAAAMYSAVQSAMAPASANFASAANYMHQGANSGEEQYDVLYAAMYDALTQAMARSNDLDRERNNILRQINEKEFSADVSTADILRGMDRANRRAGTAVVSMG